MDRHQTCRKCRRLRWVALVTTVSLAVGFGEDISDRLIFVLALPQNTVGWLTFDLSCEIRVCEPQTWDFKKKFTTILRKVKKPKIEVFFLSQFSYCLER